MLVTKMFLFLVAADAADVVVVYIGGTAANVAAAVRRMDIQMYV